MKIRHYRLAALILVLGMAVAPGQLFAAHSGHGPAAGKPSAHGGHSGHGAAQPSAVEKSRTYTTNGVIQSVDAAAKKAVITHEPIPALNWPVMTMGFAVEDAALLEGLKAGNKVRFDFYNQGTNSVIVDIETRE